MKLMAAIISVLLIAPFACAISSEQIADVRADIAQLIYADTELAAPFLRLGFHDSIGGPDGCVRCLSKPQVCDGQNMETHIYCLGCTG